MFYNLTQVHIRHTATRNELRRSHRLQEELFIDEFILFEMEAGVLECVTLWINRESSCKMMKNTHRNDLVFSALGFQLYCVYPVLVIYGNIIKSSLIELNRWHPQCSAHTLGF